MVTDFRKLSEIVRKYVNIVESVGHYQNTSLKLNTKVTQRLLIKYQIISDLQAKQEIEHRHMSTHSKSH